MSKIFNVTDSNISIVNNKVVIDLSNSGDELTAGTDYEVIFSTGAIQDLFGNNLTTVSFKFKTSGTPSVAPSTGGAGESGGTGGTSESGGTGGTSGPGEPEEEPGE